MKYFKCDECDAVNQIRSSLTFVRKCQSCGCKLGELRLYGKAEDVKYTEQDEKFEHKFLTYLAVTVLSLGILIKIFKSL